MPHNIPSARQNIAGQSPHVARGNAAVRARTTTRRKCFIVDDDPGVRKTFYAVLDGCNIELGGFASAQELLEGWGPGHPDIIFLDIALEQSDAIDVIRGLAARNYRGAVQIMSGRDRQLQDQVKHVGEQHGLNMLPALQKPFRAAQLEAVVQHYFAQPHGIERGDDAAAETPSESGIGVSLAEILRNDWLQFHYQPKIDLHKKCIIGAEVLARCRHPGRGILLPGSFLPGADGASLQELCKLALAAGGGWQGCGRRIPLKLAVNVTVNDLIELSIHAAAQQRPADPRWLIQVTETGGARHRADAGSPQLRITTSRALSTISVRLFASARLKELPAESNST